MRAHPDNGRYFTDDSGKAIYLTGLHTWANLLDIGLPGGDYAVTTAPYTGDAVLCLKEAE